MERAPAFWKVNVTALGSSACGTAVWRMTERLRITVIVKGTFDLVQDGPMRLSEPEDVIVTEVHHARNPMRSVRLTQDTAPYLPRADVLLTGHACAPEGTRVEMLSVRLAVFRGAPLLDKTIYVRGDLKDDQTVPFDRIPLTYERAYGGIGHEPNPLGTGVGAGTEKKRPNLIDPARPERPACFAPLSRGWPERKRLLGKADRRTLDQPLMEIPTGFDWSYFQAASEDQRIDYLVGDEWIILDGVHPTFGHLQSYLPGARGLARVYGMADAGDGHPLALAADTLRIDADKLRCSVVWRGSFPIPHEEALAAIRILGGVETAFERLSWPRPSVPPPRPPSPESSGAARGGATPSRPPRSKADQIPTLPLDTAAIAPGPSLAGESSASIEDVSEFAQSSTTITVDDAPPTESSDGMRGHSSDPGGEVASAPVVTPSWDRTISLDAEDKTVTADRVAMPFRSAAPGINEPPLETAERHGLPFKPGQGSAFAIPSKPHQGSRVAIPSEPPVRTDTVTLADVDESKLHPPPPSLPFQRPPPPPPSSLHSPESAEVSVEVETVPAPMVRTPKRENVVVHGVPLINQTQLAFGVVPWAMTPARDCFTVIAKATCDLLPNGPATVRAEAEPLSHESFEDGVCVYPSDFALYKVRADVTLAGRAYAPGGAADVVEVLFRFGDANNGFVRRVLVFGARRWERGLAAYKPSLPQPWNEMPLHPDRAYGGPRFEQNPVGIGYPDPMRPSRAHAPLPNLEDPSYRLRTPNQTPPPTFLSPIPLAWKERWASRGRSRSPWPCLPEDFDWTHFQAAPRPQQLAFLRGDEPFSIVGVHPRRPVLEGSLPGLRARCFAAWAQDRGGAFEEVAMHLDTVAFEVDRRTLSLVFRGTIGVPDERAPEIDALYLIAEPAGKEGMTLPDARRLLLSSDPKAPSLNP